MNSNYRTSLKLRSGCDVMKMAQKQTTTMIAAPRYTNLKSYYKRNCKILSIVILAAKKLHYNRIMEFYEIIKTKYTIHCILTYICNTILNTGIFPDRLKYAIIKPIF